MSTVFATVTTKGDPGPVGPPGYTPVFIVAAGAPSNSVGNNYDMYIDSNNGNVYGPKIGGVWGPIVCNIKGATGNTGATGPAGYSPQYIVAAGPPTAGQGNNGDMYINSSTSDVYGPKAGGAWGAVVCNIKGAQGPPGVAYTPRGAWSASTTYLQGDEATNVNVLYISLQSANLNNVPASSPSWWQAVGSGASQTPWLTDIDANNFTLKNVNKIGVGTPSPTARIGIAMPVLGGTAGNNYLAVEAATATPNGDYLRTSVVRITTDTTSWASAGWRISRVVDVSVISEIEFGNSNLSFRVGANTIQTITGTGVGIGVTNPNTQLSLGGYGSIGMQSGNSSSFVTHQYLATSGQDCLSLACNYIRTDSASGTLASASVGTAEIQVTAGLAAVPAAISFLTGATGAAPVVRMTVTATGNVGIGTNPQFRFDVNGGRSSFMPASETYAVGFRYVNTGPIFWQGADLNGDMIFSEAGGVERMRIRATGNVGIGVQIALSQLHVLGTGQATTGPSTSAGLGGTIYLQDAAGGAGNGGMVMFGFNAGAFAAIKGYAQNGSGNSVGDLIVATRRSGTDTTLTETLRCNWQGFIGIGMATPSAQLHITKDVSGNIGPIINLDNRGGGASSGSAIQFIASSMAQPICARIRSFDNNDWSHNLVFDTRTPGDPSFGLTERMRIASNGNVGIGGNNPLTRLAVFASTNPGTADTANQISVGEGTNNSAYRLAIGYFADTSWKGVIQASAGGYAGGCLLLQPLGGTVSIGSTSVASVLLDVKTAANLHFGVWNGEVGGVATTIGAFNDGFAGWVPISINPGGKVFLASGGQGVAIGKLTNAYALDVSGDVNCSGTFRVNGTAFTSGIAGIAIQLNGSAVGTQATLNYVNSASILAAATNDPSNNRVLLASNAVSDLRLKQNVTDLSGGLSAVTQLRPVAFEFNGLCGFPEGRRSASIIAQELQQVLPDAVYPTRTRLRPEDEEDTDLLCFDPVQITAHLILAVQQLQQRLTTLEGKVN